MTRTLYDKLCDSHTVRRIDDNRLLLYVDLHIMNEYTSPQAFAGLHAAGRPVWRPEAHLAVVDHVNPTRAIASLDEMTDNDARLQIENLGRNCARHGIELFDLFDRRQGIEHVVVPENGLAHPGKVIACGDSHTTTYGAFGALGFGIGTSEIEHVLATQTLVYTKLRNMRVTFTGEMPPGLTAKDLVMAFIAKVGVSGAVGHAVEFAGAPVNLLSVEGRMTMCNMAVEGGARVALIAPDATVFHYLQGRPRAPKGRDWDTAKQEWASWQSDPDAKFDIDIDIDVAAIAPQVSWGTSPHQACGIDGEVPAPEHANDPMERAAQERALEYMGLEPGQPLGAIEISHAFIGSCTNSRMEDLRAAAEVLKGRKVSAGVSAIIVPGSLAVRRQAEAEGLDRVFIEAGYEWRNSGCSMCLAMNDDILDAGARCASSTNRNFEGRQGTGARTHLMSPAMVAAASVAGHLVDYREFLPGAQT
ncbi:3-isopropylmalate dehydratase large subunit [Sulfitobacter mediterraneus]|uniref:3-isopropylmalate dehydratase large subunit n=1 Tax=Sulfitobacter mediterraneus TaxID=83219 RepID=UPI0019329D3A|nr:3-isopropylmalate dehydratase large subunit [Sulfitobacter mediterraneus]MBM1634339.1 3-isopropylmalate dehydratase large subunit [Sulfitobacter mediterraneus]MBM1642156.1 3-isopropylmalate dehydratase large subunit [Sulfitobacter mediterraneus]MBM1646205.1 3-isopropylmalate dehydratase large subunit [Sulfitobacter mediterraneus]MBM1650251.1 3-isopropylmalate dehydratase large subunit [Sulfitobacter mediterraneus]MBM1654273.1 3-isopropylmalate dehydratase large subunit [Sulfitobacter medite